MNPFKKHDVSEFENVYVPFAEAQRHKTVLAQHNDLQERGIVEDNGEMKKEATDAASNEKDVEAGSLREVNFYSPNSIEGLRAEINEDVAASGHDSIYDRM